MPFRQGVEAWVVANGDKAGASKVEFIFRDLEGPNPEGAKAIATLSAGPDLLESCIGLRKVEPTPAAA